MGPLFWYGNAQVRMWIILNINYNYLHHLGNVQEPWDILVPQNRTQGHCVTKYILCFEKIEIFGQGSRKVEKV